MYTHEDGKPTCVQVKTGCVCVRVRATRAVQRTLMSECAPQPLPSTSTTGLVPRRTRVRPSPPAMRSSASGGLKHAAQDGRRRQPQGLSYAGTAHDTEEASPATSWSCDWPTTPCEWPRGRQGRGTCVSLYPAATGEVLHAHERARAARQQLSPDDFAWGDLGETQLR